MGVFAAIILLLLSLLLLSLLLLTATLRHSVHAKSYLLKNSVGEEYVCIRKQEYEFRLLLLSSLYKFCLQLLLTSRSHRTCHQGRHPRKKDRKEHNENIVLYLCGTSTPCSGPATCYGRLSRKDMPDLRAYCLGL